ncbi:calmodulin-like isoform X2 [Macrosteles quadrilineatus]|uniref:calmodulin-like isoform X2 n=1 Tax=Macrosteles quadrilineatus TaxID=74068 RepID=UPI0023E1A8F7|nr:calmodulin-like isoform X2 [Macrosteles quadrilineatus]
MRVETTIFFTVLLGLKTIEAGQLELKHEALSKEQQEEFLLALALIDKDDDGKITDAELKHVLDNLQIEINDDEVREMIKEADTDEFCHVLLRYRQPPEDADAEDFHQSGHMLKRFFGWVRGIFSPLAKIAQKLKNCFVAIEK